MIYELIWRNKWLTSDAKTLGEMIDALRAAADELRAMQKKGVVLDENSPIADDHAFLQTDDPAVAKEFGFEQEEKDEYADEDSWVEQG